LARGRTLGSRAEELELLVDVTRVMRDASICGLGQTAANAVQSVVAKFDAFAASGGPAPTVAGDDVPTRTEEQES
jgi:NADH:ubiquinone oxidoreductase subunit F (NADH-binding)